jgi:hypothetical protein
METYGWSDALDAEIVRAGTCVDALLRVGNFRLHGPVRG